MSMEGGETGRLHAATEELIRSYHEVNGPIDEVKGSITFENLLKHIRLNRPLVVRGGCSNWRAMQWNVAYLRSKMGDRSVKVAETPSGYDPVSESGVKIFAKVISKQCGCCGKRKGWSTIFCQAT